LRYDPDKDEEDDEKDEPKGKMAEHIALPFLEFIKSSFSIGNNYIKCLLDTAKETLDFSKNTYDDLSFEQIQIVLTKYIGIENKIRS